MRISNLNTQWHICPTEHIIEVQGKIKNKNILYYVEQK